MTQTLSLAIRRGFFVVPAALGQLYEVMDRGRIGTYNERLEVLKRNLGSPQPSWRVQKLLAEQISRTDRKRGRDWLWESVQRFDASPRILPDLVQFLRQQNDEQGVKKIVDLCEKTSDRFKALCQENAKTESQRRRELAQAQNRQRLQEQSLKDLMRKKL